MHLYLKNFKNNIKFLKKSHDLTWADISKRIYMNKYPIKMSYVKKFSYGQLESLDIEKSLYIADLFGQDWYEMLFFNLETRLEANNPADWIDT